MQEVFEKIIEKLEELHERYINQYGAVGGNPMAFSVKECMEIVQEVAEEYKGIYVSKEEVGYMLDSIEMRGDETWMDYYRKALKGLCKLTDKEYNGCWIACSEKLPEEDEKGVYQH